MSECKYCKSKRVVPVLDKRLERLPNAGNPYRSRCLQCERWLPLVKKTEYKGHAKKHIMPADQDPNDPDLVAATEYDHATEIAELNERVNGGNETPGESAPSAPSEPVEPDDDPDDAAPDEQPANEFVCPADGCDAELTGRPDECSSCGATYEW